MRARTSRTPKNAARIDARGLPRAGRGGPFEENGSAQGLPRLYERRMLDANAMDFDDLLMRTVNECWELFDDVRARYRDRFRWVLVDEYQDTNHAHVPPLLEAAEAGAGPGT